MIKTTVKKTVENTLNYNDKINLKCCQLYMSRLLLIAAGQCGISELHFQCKIQVKVKR